jgi:WD40 repeat protein
MVYSLSESDRHSFANDVWVLDLARTPSGALASISSDQALSVFDPSAPLRSGPLRTFPTSHGNLTTLRVFGESVVCTAGENGTVEVWDLRAAARVSQFTGECRRCSLK